MIYDWQERTGMLVGEEMLDHFRASTVAVIGVGGVGGYAAEMIVRAGIGHLIILDSDDVSLTNKNRQLLALDSTVGRPKCDVLADLQADSVLKVVRADVVERSVLGVLKKGQRTVEVHEVTIHIEGRKSTCLI